MAAIAASAGASAAGSIVGGIIASQQAKKAAAAQAAATQAAITELQKVGIPSIEAQKIVLQNPAFVEQYVAQQAQAEQQGQSQFNNIQESPELRGNTLSAISKMNEQASAPLTATEKAELNAQRRTAESGLTSNMGRILQEQQARGMLSGDQELAAKMQAAQATMQQEAQGSQSMMGQAQQRALDSLLNSSNMSAQLRAADFGQASQKASAQDVINAFNTQNRQQTGLTNTSAQNAANLRNVEAKQSLENQRAINANLQETNNKGLLQQQYNNELGKAQAMAGAYTGQANMIGQQGAAQAANTMGMYQGIGQAAAGGAQAYSAHQDSQAANQANRQAASDNLSAAVLNSQSRGK